MQILIIDDHVLIRKGLIKMARDSFNGSTIDEASNGKAGLQLLKKNKYDLLILDLQLPDKNGLEILQYMKDFDLPCHTVVLSFHSEVHFVGRAFNLGAAGYISKNASYNEIRLAIQKVAQGRKYIPPEYAEMIAFGKKIGSTPHEDLSNRELQVMLYLARGKSVTEISAALHIADKTTVSTYKNRVLQKMQMQNVSELTIYGLQKQADSINPSS